jgi:anaerobic ribonucleoside-triphosphate reductase activating protein
MLLRQQGHTLKLQADQKGEEMNYHNITKDDMNNGAGLRVVLWVAGCSHHCRGCQNPQTWDPESGVPFDDNDAEEIFAELSKDYISGLTLSGGDPFYMKNRDVLEKLCKEVKERFPDKTIWSWTGYTYEEIKDVPLLKYIDVLVDGKYDESVRNISLEWRGSENQRVLYLKNGEIVGQGR